MVLLQQKRRRDKQTESNMANVHVGETGNGDRDKWYEYTNGEMTLFEGIGNDIKFAMAKASYNFLKLH